MLEFYTFVADNYAPFYSLPIEYTDRDAAFVLDELLYNESELARYPSIILPDFSRLGELLLICSLKIMSPGRCSCVRSNHCIGPVALATHPAAFSSPVALTDARHRRAEPKAGRQIDAHRQALKQFICPSSRGPQRHDDGSIRHHSATSRSRGRWRRVFP